MKKNCLTNDLFQVAELVSSEFFEQGDIERKTLNITPIVSLYKINGISFLNLQPVILSFKKVLKYFF